MLHLAGTWVGGLELVGFNTRTYILQLPFGVALVLRTTFISWPLLGQTLLLQYKIWDLLSFFIYFLLSFFFSCLFPLLPVSCFRDVGVNTFGGLLESWISSQWGFPKSCCKVFPSRALTGCHLPGNEHHTTHLNNCFRTLASAQMPHKTGGSTQTRPHGTDNLPPIRHGTERVPDSHKKFIWPDRRGLQRRRFGPRRHLQCV
jgi:hypothetical protein